MKTLVTVDNEIQQKLNSFFSDYKEKLLELQTKQWLEEDNFEKSNTYLKLAKYWALALNSLLMYVDRNLFTQEILFSTYNYDKLKDCAGCEQISYDRIIKHFIEYPLIGKGIETLGIECTFEVEPENLPKFSQCFSSTNSSNCSSSFLNNLNETCTLKFTNIAYGCD